MQFSMCFTILNQKNKMKCRSCKFYIISKMQGNHCGCMGTKPCDRDRKYKERRGKQNKRRNKYEED